MGAQAGSEAKGKMSAYLVEKFRPDVLTMASSPNAGHTVVDGHLKLVTYHLPAGLAKAKYGVTVVLGPSSIINVDILAAELKEVMNWVDMSLVIDPRATIITPAMVKMESATLTKIGSTAQGVGMARVARIMRVGTLRVEDVRDELISIPHCPISVSSTTPFLHKKLNAGATILHESTQGFDLCLDHGIDPVYCTTRNITTAGALAEMGISPSQLGYVYGVLRPYPIRVNNRDGWSGPYADADEITWEEVGRRCGARDDITEKTTTTKLQRRVFEMSYPRLGRFCQVCNPDFLCLQFANYLDWSIYGKTKPGSSDIPPKVVEFIHSLRQYAPVAYLGTGPDHTHMIDLGVDNE